MPCQFFSELGTRVGLGHAHASAVPRCSSCVQCSPLLLLLSQRREEEKCVLTVNQINGLSYQAHIASDDCLIQNLINHLQIRLFVCFGILDGWINHKE